MSEAATREPHRLIAATVGVAIPRDRELYGYLSEHHSFGESEDIAGDYAEELAAEMLATTLGLDFDPDKSWDVKTVVYRPSTQIVRTQNVTQTSIGATRKGSGRPSSPRRARRLSSPASFFTTKQAIGTKVMPYVQSLRVFHRRRTRCIRPCAAGRLRAAE
jgi:hypothetical protein